MVRCCVFGIQLAAKDEARDLEHKVKALKWQYPVEWHSESTVVLDEGEWNLVLSCKLEDTSDIFLKDLADILDASVEVWIEAPCRIPLLNATCEDLDVPGFAKHGCTVFRRALSAADVEVWSSRAEERISLADATLARKFPEITVGKSVLHFSELGSRGDQRFDLLFDPAQEGLRDLTENAPWVEAVIVPALGASFKCNTSIIYSRPGAPDQGWHCDGRHLMKTPYEGSDEGCYGICVFVPLMGLDPTVGCTQFWLGTHRYDCLVGFGGAAELLGGVVDGYLQAGDAFVYDYRLMHRGRANLSESTQRCILQLLYTVPNYKETKNYGTENLFD